MPEKIKAYGFDPVATRESITPEDYVFGDGQLALKLGVQEIIMSDGQWDNVLPEKEIQKFPWGDTFGCTVFGTENIVQMLMRKKYGMTEEYSERYLSVLSGIVNFFGGSPHTVFEQWRKKGNLLYEHLPFEGVDSWDEFMSPKPMTKQYLDIGKVWTDNWKLAHEWIWDFRAENLMNALQYSPLGIGVLAWYSENGIYKNPNNAPDNHWVALYGYVKGKYWKVFDHYDSVHKKLDWNYPFKFVKTAGLERLTIIPPPTNNEDEIMTFYKTALSPKVYMLGADGMYHHIIDEPVFAGLFGDIGKVKIDEIVIEDHQIGFTVYDKRSFLDSIIYYLKGK